MVESEPPRRSVRFNSNARTSNSSPDINNCSSAIGRSINAAEDSISGLQALICRLNDANRSLRTEFNREFGARRVLFGSIWRSQNAVEYRFNCLKED